MQTSGLFVWTKAKIIFHARTRFNPRVLPPAFPPSFGVFSFAGFSFAGFSFPSFGGFCFLPVDPGVPSGAPLAGSAAFSGAEETSAESAMSREGRQVLNGVNGGREQLFVRD